MKRILLPVLCFLLILTACNKNTSDPQSTIVADIDGTTETFNNSVIGIKIDTLGAVGVTVTGLNGTTNNSDRFIIAVGGPKPLTTGALIFDPPAGENSAVITYILPNASDGYGPADLGGTNPITVNITSITSTNIQGTFSGTLALHDGSNPIHKAITNGKFNVNYK